MKKNVSKQNIKLKGIISIPADKSISHRAILFSSLCKGTSYITNFSNGKDPNTSLNIMKELGITIDYIYDNKIKVTSSGKLTKPMNTIDCQNSGTTVRLLSGILARQDFDTTLIGDCSLSKRPMKRIIAPLISMGAQIQSNDGLLPLVIKGGKLRPITYNSPIASAQVKSSILLAGLGIDGTTTFIEPYKSRNHTEIMLKNMGADIRCNKNIVTITKSELRPISIEISGDISSAAYFIVATLIIPNSEIILKNVNLNPTRTGILDVVKKMGGNIEITDLHEMCAETVGDIKVKYSQLKACKIEGEMIPLLIDEIPIIALLATQAKGDTEISDAKDLRNKESDRITTIVNELNKLGANIEEKEDGMIIHGKTNLTGNCEVKSYCDHRLAMTMYVAGLICKKEIQIDDFEWVNISFPNFEQLFEEIIIK